MHPNAHLIENFYSAFAKRDAEAMNACYHDDIVFEDPAFGKLKGDRAKAMWKMLIAGGKESSTVIASNIKADDALGSANWVANYVYGTKERKVENHIYASFEFTDGKISKHTDVFDLWKWSRQAIGLAGYLLGWTSFMRNKIQKKTETALNAYMTKR
ncbi:MAG: ketosteroid isomerase-like protein [Flavobacteriales bacterium]|jgi:ketosteroid isomerase-like protein